MWQRLKNIVKKLFKIPIAELESVQRYDRFSEQYRDMRFNLTAIAANKLATFVVTESNVDVGKGDDETNPRVKLLNDLMQKVWSKAKKITAQAFGCGGVALIPNCVNGTIYFDIVQQDRMIISSVLGDQITGVCFLSDIQIIDDDVYSRFTYYSITNKGCVIKNKAVKNLSAEIPLNKIPSWSDIPEEITIPNCKKVPVAYLKCPTDNRRSDDLKGVPITFGCEYIMDEIAECLEQIKDEYKYKKPIIFADTTLFSENEDVDRNLYKTFAGGKLDGSALIDIFDPQIRDSAYYKRLESLFEIMEKSMGTSKGILSEPATNYATATEIKRSIYDTFAMVDVMRKTWERAAQDLLDAFIVLCNFYGLTVYSDDPVPLKFDWSYGLVESSEITFQQLSECNSRGVIADAELRQFVKPKETLAEAQSAIEQIQKDSPRVEDVFEYDVQKVTAQSG